MTASDMVLTPMGLRFEGRVLPCSIGKYGLSAAKCEGDGATPKGVHLIVGMLFRADRVARPNAWARPIGLRDLWSDDAKDSAYNHLVRAPHRFSHERLRRADQLYDLILLTNWNWPCAQTGKGSAIFMHQWRRPGFPTEGCIALRRTHLRWLAGRIKKRSRLIIV